MMTLLSLVGGSLMGPLFRFVTVPIIALCAITGAHLLIENWKGNLRAQGESACNSAWEARVREEERNKAWNEVDQAHSLLIKERQLTGELNDKLANLNIEMDALRFSGAYPNDDKCLSDGVLDSLERRPHGANAGSKPAGKRQKTPAAKPAAGS